MEINFISYKTFIRDIKEFVKKLPKFGAVAYIPDSGIFPALIYSKHHHVPIFNINELKTFHDILIFDDTVRSGRTLNLIQQKVKGKFAAVYVAGENDIFFPYQLDSFYKEIPTPRIFEWNWLKETGVLEKSCFDLDGVLCRAPTEKENDDGPKYLNFIKTATPLFIPYFKVGAIVTARLEKYREETEEWLKRNQIDYGKLIMLNSTAEERTRLRLHAKHKIKNYTNKFILFVEDEEHQAREIARQTKKPVLCVSNFELY